MNENVKNLIGWWILREKRISNDNYDPFIRFFIYYMCLDAWITADSGKDTDKDKILWLCSTNNHLKQIFLSNSFKKSNLEALKNQEIEDMRPGHRGQIKKLINTNDFNQVIEFIYQIRCNLFHGQKSPQNNKDQTLVEHAGRFLGYWIRWADIKYK